MQAQTELKITVTVDPTDGEIAVNEQWIGLRFYEKTPFYYIESTGCTIVVQNVRFTRPDLREHYLGLVIQELIKRKKIKL
jgi:hypothetical protein